jgi:hypothetical protein
MTYKTKKPTDQAGLMRNKQQIDDSLNRRKRLSQSLKESFNAGLIPASWVAEIARVGGCHV